MCSVQWCQQGLNLEPCHVRSMLYLQSYRPISTDKLILILFIIPLLAPSSSYHHYSLLCWQEPLLPPSWLESFKWLPHFLAMPNPVYYFGQEAVSFLAYPHRATPSPLSAYYHLVPYRPYDSVLHYFVDVLVKEFISAFSWSCISVPNYLVLKLNFCEIEFLPHVLIRWERETLKLQSRYGTTTNYSDHVQQNGYIIHQHLVTIKLQTEHHQAWFVSGLWGDTTCFPPINDLILQMRSEHIMVNYQDRVIHAFPSFFYMMTKRVTVRYHHRWGKDSLLRSRQS